MQDSSINPSDVFTSAEIKTLSDSFHVSDDQLKIKKHPVNADRLLLHVDYEIPIGRAAAACSYLNAYFFEPIDSPADRLVFQPNLKAFVGSTPGQTDLYVTFSRSDKARLLTFLASHQDELAYVHSNISVADGFRRNVTFPRARAQLESGLYL